MVGDGPDAGPVPPEVLCHNGNCLPLPAEVRANMVLLLWPSNLPAVGSPVDVWPDQSGQGNDAHALYPTALPHVIPNGVQLDASQRGSGFVVFNSPSLDFGSGDFAVIVVAGLSSSTNTGVVLPKVGRRSRKQSSDFPGLGALGVERGSTTGRRQRHACRNQRGHSSTVRGRLRPSAGD